MQQGGSGDEARSSCRAGTKRASHVQPASTFHEALLAHGCTSCGLCFGARPYEFHRNSVYLWGEHRNKVTGCAVFVKATLLLCQSLLALQIRMQLLGIPGVLSQRRRYEKEHTLCFFFC